MGFQPQLERYEEPGAITLTKTHERALTVYAAVLLSILGLMAYFAFSVGTDRNDWLALANRMRDWGGNSGSLVVLSACYYVGSLLSLPGLVMLTVLVTCLGPAKGLTVVISGTAASSVTVHWLARRLGRSVVAELYPEHLEQVESLLKGPPLLRVLQMRLLPVLPFHLVNAVCGLVGIGMRPFLVGTILGLLPKMLVHLYFVRTLLRGLTAPGTVMATNVVVSLTLFAVVTLVGIKLEGYIRARDASREPAAEGAPEAAPEEGPEAAPQPGEASPPDVTDPPGYP